jgi:putative sugar O-methyltransferase
MSRRRFNVISVEDTIQIVVSLVQANQLDLAARVFERADIENPHDPRIPPHQQRVQHLISRAADPDVQVATQSMLEVIASMKHEVDADPLYAPGKFWAWLCQVHIDLLRLYGIEFFKRTVSHQYQNWLMTSFDDPQVRRLLETWSTHFHVEPLFTEIETLSHVGLPPSLDLGKPEYPLVFREQREVYRLAVSLLWEYVLTTDGFSVLKDLDELDVGNPIRIRRHGRLISSDVAHSVRERNLFLKACGLTGVEGLTVGELGAGHGRLAEIFGRTTNYRYMVFDIPPALYVSQWYISKIFPDEKIFTYRHFDSYSEIAQELRQSRFAFFTANQIKMMPDGVLDLFCNMNSLMEMPMEQIHNFITHIQRLTRIAFLSRQWIQPRNETNQTTLVEKDFFLGDGWQKVLAETDDIHPQFFNHVWKRES